MTETALEAQTIARFLQNFTSTGNLRLRFRVKLKGAKPVEAAPEPEESARSQGELFVEFTGPDTPLLIARNGELLHALEHIATKMLRLEPEDHHRVSFDADHFKAKRDQQIQSLAQAGIARVRASGEPHAFPPMSSRERRMLHLLLAESGLPTASSGEGPNRFVVLYPEGADPVAEPFTYAQEAPSSARRPDANNLRRAFRHR